MNPFPPQAYTRETMVKAYQWLQSQNPNVRELATTPDLLVSLYLKAQLQGNECFDRPSIQNFKSELKSLAGMMGEFETAPAAEALTEASLARMGERTATAVQPPPPQQPVPPPPSAQPAGAYVRQPAPSPQASPPRASHHQSAAAGNDRSVATFDLDPRSLQMIQEVKAQMNLSSDIEALRAIISIGYTKFKRFSEHS